MLNYKKCQCCDRTEMKIIGRVGDYEKLNCQGCGYVRFVNASKEVNNTLYETDTDYNDDLNVANDFEDFIQWNHNKSLQYLKSKYSDGNASVLDLGCFTGFFVKKLLTLGFDACGIDFNNKALEYGKTQYGLDTHISNQTLSELLMQGKRFDVITLFEVIEHLENIEEVFIQVSCLLKTGGAIIISTPNSNMCWRPALDNPPHHLSRFTPNALHSCATRFGFQPIHSYEQMSLYDLIRNYVGTFFREKQISSLRGGAFKNKSSIRALRIYMNKMKTVGSFVCLPFDKVLHAFGLRYICQLVIAEKQ